MDGTTPQRDLGGTAAAASDRTARYGDPLDLLTPEGLCALLKVRRSWLYDAVEAGTLPSLRLGRQLRFRRRDVLAFIESNVAVRG